MSVRSLVKRYPGSRVNAVDDVSFSVRSREIFGLLGPNGAGKTTTVDVLTTRARPTSGEVSVGGVNVVRWPVRARAVLAVVPQRTDLDRSLSVIQNLSFHAAYHGFPYRAARGRAQELLRRFGLADRAKDKADRLSGGQAQRLMVARALMHAPSVLFCDEPTTGLDPAARLYVWDQLRSLASAGVTIMLTTHDMHEAAELTDRVAIMDHGHLLALDTADELIKTLPTTQTLDASLAVAAEREPGVLRDLGAAAGIERVERLPAGSSRDERDGPLVRVRLYVSGDASRFVGPLVDVLEPHGARLVDIAIDRAGLDDVFLHHTGRTLR